MFKKIKSTDANVNTRKTESNFSNCTYYHKPLRPHPASPSP